MVATWVQSVGSLFAAIVSAVALIVAISAFRSQERVNDLAQDRLDRRYAERVSWWATRRSGGVVSIQNRSPIPVLDVTLLMIKTRNVDSRHFSGDVRDTTSFQISDIPPCTVAHVGTVADQAEPPEPSIRPDFQPAPIITYAVQFYDGVRLWKRDRSGLHEQPEDLVEADITVVATTVSTDPATDCGVDA